MSSKLVILGSGTSYGVPVIGCSCDVCASEDKRDKRTRAAAWLCGERTSLLFDVGPDFRYQCLRHGVRDIDGVLLTHTHADHLNGLDDLRAFTLRSRRVLPVFGHREHLSYVRSHFEYIFEDNMAQFGWGIPRLELTEVATSPFEIGEFRVQPVPLCHGHWRSTGYRIGGLAYLTDCSRIPDESWQYLEGLDTLVIDALRWRPHVTHMSIGESLEVVERLRPRQAFLTHICHEISHEAESKKLPPNVFFAYDGLRIEIDCKS